MTPVDRSKYLSMAEVAQLRQSVLERRDLDMGRGWRQGIVTWAVVETALATGLRRQELVRLTVGDFIPADPSLLVWRLKRKPLRQETLAIDPALAETLRQFIDWKRGYRGEPCEPTSPLFMSERGRAFAGTGLARIWAVAVERAGLSRPYSIHAARHTLGMRLLHKTGNIRLVQKVLGHADVQTTAKFYADIPFADVARQVKGLYDEGE